MGLEKIIPWNGNDTAANYQKAWDDYRNCVKMTEHTLYGMTYDRLKKEEAGLQWPCPTVKSPGTAKRYVRGEDPLMDMPEITKVQPSAVMKSSAYWMAPSTVRERPAFHALVKAS